ncbi:acetyl-CoA C-acyltransferase [Streptomyces plumbiresistens]|uniref:Acetyl-CoA C-acetyltransferase n=1 Tax=Streptomyces plumbiresistens TaxID=511811 RepID=A0ABP7SKR6_9ACTN
MNEALIVSAVRTPIGRSFRGSLVNERPEDLATFAVKRALAALPALDPAEVDDVVIGVGVASGMQGDCIGRRVAYLAGLRDVPGTTVQRLCASGLDAIRIAAQAIRCGEADVVVAAGVESTSQAQEAQVFHPQLERDHYYWSMAETAENVADRWNISREVMDAFALQSQERTAAAQASGFFDREISAYTTADGTIVTADDCPRPGSTMEKLAQLQPIVREDGRVTAGNACPVNDAAAAVVLMSDRRAQELGIAARARVLSSAVTGLDPAIMGVGPIEAVRKALKRAGLGIDDVDVLELNEAFAAQVLAVADGLGIEPRSHVLNPHGGGIALGHPIGATGVRMMATLLNGLETVGGRIGVETMCVGGGQGAAMVVERVS